MILNAVSSYLLPAQVVVNVSNSAERAYEIIVQVDLRNAFNATDRFGALSRVTCAALRCSPSLFKN